MFMLKRLKAPVTVLVFALSAAMVVRAATQNYLAKYSSVGSLIDSAIYESSGKVGIGTTNPYGPIDIAAQVSTPADGVDWTRNLPDTPAAATGVGGGMTFSGYKAGSSLVGILLR